MKLPLIALTLAAISAPAFADMNDSDLRNVKSVKLTRDLNFGTNLSDDTLYLDPFSVYQEGTAASELVVVGEANRIKCEIRPIGTIYPRKEVVALAGREYRVSINRLGQILLARPNAGSSIRIDCREKASQRPVNGASINPYELAIVLDYAEVQFDPKGTSDVLRQEIKFKGDFQTQMEEIKVKFKGDVETQLEEIEI